VTDKVVMFWWCVASGIAFGAWQSSVGAGWFMALVLFAVLGSCDDLTDAIKERKQ
jgi:hypothetical protein